VRRETDRDIEAVGAADGWHSSMVAVVSPMACLRIRIWSCQAISTRTRGSEMLLLLEFALERTKRSKRAISGPSSYQRNAPLLRSLAMEAASAASPTAPVIEPNPGMRPTALMVRLAAENVPEIFCARSARLHASAMSS
jgi:hypothetical protein